MGYYVIAVGGTGNKILESMVYGACAGIFHTLNADGKQVPISKIHLLAVDVDAACGNTTRAKQAGEYYERVRKMFDAANGPRRGFHTELKIERWNMNLAKRATSVERMVQNHKQDQLLARTLFDDTEAALEYSEGFRGHPDLGVLFFADILNGLEDAARSGQPDEMLRMMSEMQADINRGEAVKVMLLGSIFGGTGASGIPSISQYLRKRFERHSPLFEMAAVLMLPYYKVPPSSQNEEMEIVVKSSAFLDKARTALQYYGMEGVIRSGEEDQSGIYDAVYLLGLPPEAFVMTHIYSTGSQSQENDAHMLEWLAMRCIARFFRTGFRGENSHNMDCYYYQLHSRTFSWDSFDEEAELYRRGFGGLLKAAVAFFAECYPYLRARITGEKKGKRSAVGYYAAWFHKAHRLSAPEQAALERNLEALYHCLAYYANWMIQLVGSLPPTLRKNRALEKAVQDMTECYKQVVDRYVLLHERYQAMEENGATDAEQAEYARLESEYDHLLTEQYEGIQQIGGGLYLGILKNAQIKQREKLHLQEAAIAGLQEQLRRWQNEDSHLVDARTLPQEEERLFVMCSMAESIKRKRRKIAEDIEIAIRENITATIPLPEDTGEALPENDLFSTKLLSQLHELLSLNGLRYEARDPARMEKLSMALQRGITKLIVQRVPDRADMVRMMAGVSGNGCTKRHPDAMLAGFWGALLGASLEEERA